MPKETIRMTETPDDNVFDVKVGWTKDMHMQIGLEDSEERSLFWVLAERKKQVIGAEINKMMAESNYIDDTQLGENVLNMLDVICGPSPGIWTTPSRHKVNELIRVLRRARDSAFGRDE